MFRYLADDAFGVDGHAFEVEAVDDVELLAAAFALRAGAALHGSANLLWQVDWHAAMQQLKEFAHQDILSDFLTLQRWFLFFGGFGSVRTAVGTEPDPPVAL